MRLRCFLFSGCLSVATLAASLVLAIASDRAFAPTALAHDCGNWPANPDARCYAIAQESGGPWGGASRPPSQVQTRYQNVAGLTNAYAYGKLCIT